MADLRNIETQQASSNPSIISPLVGEWGELSTNVTCDMPALYAAKPSNRTSSMIGQFLILGYGRLALTLGINA